MDAPLHLSAEFWFGVLLLSLHQASKFGEVHTLDPAFLKRYTSIPNLRANDFVSQRQFVSLLLAYIAVTLAIYTILCLMSPSVLEGYAKIIGKSDPAQFPTTVPYPVYIAAIMMGLSQSPVPVVDKITNAQRDIFHFLLGIPARIIEAANSYSTQIIARADESAKANIIDKSIELNKAVTVLTSSAYIARIDSFADTVFYKEELTRLAVPIKNGGQELNSNSERELCVLIEQLVYASAIATARESGSGALTQLAEVLSVTPFDHQKPDIFSTGLSTGVIACLTCIVALWFGLPMLTPYIVNIIGNGSPLPFWPTTIDLARGYIFAQMMPLYLSVVILLLMGVKKLPPKVGLLNAIQRNSVTLLLIIAFVIAFDYIQILSDIGLYGKDATRALSAGTLLEFLIQWFPYNLLHSLVTVAVIVPIVAWESRSDDEGGAMSKIVIMVVMIISVVIVSAFYAKARLFYQYALPSGGADFLLAVSAANVVAAMSGFAMATMVLAERRAAADALARARGGAPEPLPR